MERIGRTQRVPLASQRMDLGQETAASACRKQVGEQRGGGPPLLLLDREPDRPLRRLPLLAVVQGEAGGLEEPLDRLLGRIDARPFALHRDVGLHRRQAAHEIRARRRGVAKDLNVLVGEPGLLEPRAGPASQALPPRPACIRAGISSESTSSSRSGMTRAHM